MNKIFTLVLVATALFAADLKELSKECEQGSKKACINFFYASNDLAKNAEFAHKLCKNGHFLGCDMLANLYNYGLGVEKDAKKALEFYKKSCDGGEDEGCLGLGAMQMALKDENGAKTLQRLLSSDDLRVKTFVNFALFGADEKNLANAKALCQSEQYADGCLLLAMFYDKAAEYEKSAPLYKQACDKGVKQACGLIKK